MAVIKYFSLIVGSDEKRLVETKMDGERDPMQ